MENFNQSAISATIGARFNDEHANPTESIKVLVNLSEINQLPEDHRDQVMQSLLERGLYVVLSELKASLPKEVTREQFATAMRAINIKQIASHCLVSRSRGRAASEYPQGTRLNEIKFLKESAIRALMKGESFPIIDYEGLDVTARNKTVSDGGFREKAEMAYLQLTGAYDTLENGAERAICGRLSAWISSAYGIEG